MTRRTILLGWLLLAACSSSVENAGIVLAVDADATVAKAAINRLIVTVDSQAQTWLLASPLPGSLGFTTGPGSKAVTVDGYADATLLGQWSGQLQANKGAVASYGVVLTCVAVDGGSIGTGGAMGTGGGGGTDAAMGTGGVLGVGGAFGGGGMTGTGGGPGTGGVSGVGGTSGRGGSPGSGGATGGSTGRGGGPGTGGTPGTGGIVGRGGTPGTGGTKGTGGATSTGGSTGTGALCEPAAEYGANDNLGTVKIPTTEAYCFRVLYDIQGWGCSNMAERTVKVNGVVVACSKLPLPAKTADGWYYFDISAGTVTYGALYWY
jgi:hypothetical protein